jgi:hypothetical protein
MTRALGQRCEHEERLPGHRFAGHTPNIVERMILGHVGH